MADGSKKPGRRPPGSISKLSDAGLCAGWVQMPVLVEMDRRVSKGAKVVYGVILYHAIKKRHSWPSQTRIALMTGESLRSVRRHIQELKTRGLVKVTKYGMPAKNVYHFAPLDQVYTSEEIDFFSEIRSTQEYAEYYRSLGFDLSLESDQVESDEGFEGSEWEEQEEDPVPKSWNFPDRPPAPVRPATVGRSYRPKRSYKTDEDLSLRERSNELNEKKEPRSAEPTLSGLSQDENHPEETRKTRSIPDKLAVVEEVVPGRERTYVSPSLDKGYNESDVTSELHSTNGQERSYGKSPSGVHEGFAEVTKPAPRTPPRGSQVSSSPYDVPSSPRPSLTAPKDEEPATQAAAVHRLYADWRAEVVARFKGVANDIPLKIKWTDNKLRSCVVALLSKFAEPTADGQPGYDSILRVIRVAAWDWEAIKVHEGAKWCAKGSPYPTLREIHLLSDFLLGFTATGVTAAPDHRVSNYHEQFLATRTPVEETDEIGRIAKQEKKTRAAVIREMQAGRKPG